MKCCISELSFFRHRKTFALGMLALVHVVSLPVVYILEAYVVAADRAMEDRCWA